MLLRTEVMVNRVRAVVGGRVSLPLIRSGYRAGVPTAD